MVFPINVARRLLLLVIRMFTLFFMQGLLRGQFLIRKYASPLLLWCSHSWEENPWKTPSAPTEGAGTDRTSLRKKQMVWLIETILRTPALGKASVRHDPSPSKPAPKHLYWTQSRGGKKKNRDDGGCFLTHRFLRWHMQPYELFFPFVTHRLKLTTCRDFQGEGSTYNQIPPSVPISTQKWLL